MAIGYEIESLGRSGSTGLVTVKTVTFHPFRVGDKVRLYNVLGGGTAYPFMAGNPYTIGSVTVQTGGTASDRFTYTQTGALVSADMLTTINISSGTQFASSRDRIQIVTAEPHNLTTQPRIRISGVTHPSGVSLDLLQRINGIHSTEDVTVVNSTTLIIRLIRNFDTFSPLGQPLSYATAKLEYIPTGAVVALDDGINATSSGSIGGIGITTNQSRFYRLRNEGQIIAGVLGLAAQSKGIDYPFRRLFDVTDETRLVKSPLKTRVSINTAATTLRSALDTVIEVYQGSDAKKRRYYVNLDGQLVYEIVDDSIPATATAPYKIVTASVGDPNTSTGAASVVPYALEVEWDHDTTKRALFTTASRSGSPIADLVKVDSPDALGTAYKRNGAPYFDEAVDYPAGTDERLITRQQGARSFFLERHAPILSGRFTLRGAGTATWNALGFSSGYALISTPGSTVIPVGEEIPKPATRSGSAVTLSTFPFAHQLSVGMPVTISGITDGANAKDASGTAFNQSSVVSVVDSARSFTYNLAGSMVGVGANGYNQGDVRVTAYPSFIRTGTAPNQIVTATYPYLHGISNGAVTVISGLTSTAGTSMNGTVTATVTSPYVFTYPSTGTNGTATGTATVSSTSLVPRWEPGMFVDISASALGVSGLYRVEEVATQFEEGSYQQIITITFNRRQSKTLSKLIKEKA